MTSHQFAQKLLSMPDLPIATPRVEEWSDDEEDNLREPTITLQEFKSGDERPHQGILISH